MGLVAKRVVDILVALFGLIILMPLLAGVAVCIRCCMGSPVLFRQQRPGYRGRPFWMVKFRTMRDACDRSGRPLSDSERLTRVGKLLRATSLDELPELWNVLRGDMSIVGPRPLLMAYLERYTPQQARRHEVKPGITGWAQINGRNAISWEQKFDYDVWYVDHWNLWLDVRILCKTIGKVFKREGITQEGAATMEEFMGTAQATSSEQEHP